MNVQELKELIENYNKDICAGYEYIANMERQSIDSSGARKHLAASIIIRNDLIKQLDRELQKETNGLVVGQDNGR